jgi:predicted GNAT superfamily acetyltransferase
MPQSNYQITRLPNHQMPSISYRRLTTLDEYAAVVELERIIWGPAYVEVVPVPILAVTVLRGGTLIGAFDGERMVGFVYALAGLKDGRPTQWSHMLGVIDEFRNEGVGHQLKMLQRDRALALGLDLIEWTFDPMQALNAHLNFSKLGIVVQEYEVNVYGTSHSPLHGGNPTDRFVAEWNIREPHVERRLAAAESRSAVPLRAHDVSEAEAANRLVPSSRWFECADVRLDLCGRRVLVDIPMGFTGMLADAPDLALAWRMATREVFTTYFSRGYKAVDFFLNKAAGRGAYLLVT